MRAPYSVRVFTPQTTWVEVTRSPQRKPVQDHALVLQAVGIPSGTAHNGTDHVLVVRLEDAERARVELTRYDNENRGWPPRETAPIPISAGVHAAIVYGGLLALAYVFEVQQSFGLDWGNVGAAQAARIRAGEWWRSLTALTLHADLSHLAGNIVFGALFAVILAQSVGVGIAWWAFLVTGAVGNAINAYVQPPAHTSIGASTAVFGLLGVQAAYEWMRRRELRYQGWRRWAPLVMGAALLAWLGTGGQSVDPHDMPQALKNLDTAVRRIDILAHVFGFAVGVASGIVLGRIPRASLRGKWQGMLAAAAPVALAAAWYFAFKIRA